MTTLASLPVLLLDAQATAADPARGALLEIGWAPWTASEGRELAAADVTAHVVAQPSGAALPPAVARITGLRGAEWERGVPPMLVWERLLATVEARWGAAPGPVPVAIHFVRFEEPFLRALHHRHGTGTFPFRLVCTHAIARRLLPEGRAPRPRARAKGMDPRSTCRNEPTPRALPSPHDPAHPPTGRRSRKRSSRVLRRAPAS